MHRVKNIFERVCSMRNLRLAAKEALRGKRTRPAGATFFMEMEKELPALHEELRDIITRSPSLGDLKAAANAQGMRSLRDDGLAKAFAGQTTVDELIRITES